MMVGLVGLDETQALLLATSLATRSDLNHLQLLVSERKDEFSSTFLYALLLTYLPAEAENIAALTTFLAHLQDGFQNVSALDASIEESQIQEYCSQNDKKSLHELRFDKLGYSENVDTYDDELGAFVTRWLQKVEMISGMPSFATQLLTPFTASRPKLLLWQDSYLIPLIKLQNDFYPGRAEYLSTKALEDLQGPVGVKLLLQFAEHDKDGANVGRDLREVVAPWVYGSSRSKRRRLDSHNKPISDASWNDVNSWIYTTSHTNLNLAAKSFLDWNGPSDKSMRSQDVNPSDKGKLTVPYAQTGLALIVTSSDLGRDANNLLNQILDRAASLSLPALTDSAISSKRTLSEASRADLLESSLLQYHNPLTHPSEDLFEFLQHCLSAQSLLENLKLVLPVSTILEAALFDSEEKQKHELQRILQQIPRLTNTEVDWPLLRQQLHALRTGAITVNLPEPKRQTYHFLGRVPIDYLESEFLNTLLTASQYSIITDIYLDSTNTPLSKETVQEHILSAIYESYDNASNGNRTRGGIKRAAEMMKAFKPRFPSEPGFDHIEYLIQATHSLSFYQLTLQHGVPFQPVNIRAHTDPISLLEKVVLQNTKAFTKLDDLIEIGRNLVRANLPNASDPAYSTKSMAERLFDVEHRVTYLAITAALSDNDFDTAYSYITTRLATSPSQALQLPFTDDTSWRAAYAAGKYRPSTSPKNVHDRITALSKRMDLLSLALTLAPTPEPLSEILATWRRCEEELESLKSQAIQEERDIEGLTRNNGALPGGFVNDTELDAAETRRLMERRALGGSGPSYEEDAPMGLFDVARGAASAFKKSAFPLRGSGGQKTSRHDESRIENEMRDSLDEPRSSGEYQRVRKRDMVSNMVTGGLVSGMSWVLGAPPPTQTDERE